jgi:hypothetical protein
MTREHFDIQLGRLIVLRNWPDDVSEWWTACRTVDPEVFEAACSQALKSRSFFPLPAELLADCDAVKAHVRPVANDGPSWTELDVEQTAEIRNPFGGASIFVKVIRDWHHDCETCGDTGWSMVQCPTSHCGRRFDHSPHGFAEKCSCIEWNPTIRRRKEAQVRYHTKAEAA